MRSRFLAFILLGSLWFTLSACSNGPVGNMGLSIEELPSADDEAGSPQSPGTTTSTTSTSTTLPPADFRVTSTNVVRVDSYNANVSFALSFAGLCRMSSTSGSSFGALYDNTVGTNGNFDHSKSVGLPGAGTHTRYFVCQRSSNSEALELVVTITDSGGSGSTTPTSSTTTTLSSTTTTISSTTTTISSTTTTTVASCQNYTTQQLALVEGLNTCGATAMEKPALNVPYIDPRYGTKITRVTDASQITTLVPAWVRHEYSRKPAFNSDSTRAIMISSNGWIRLYSVNKTANTMSFVKNLNLAETQESIWHPTNPDLIYHFGQYGLGMKIYSYNVNTDISTDLTPTLPAQIQSIFPTAGLAWFKQEGRPSDDGKIWCLQVETSSFQMLGLISFNLETGSIIGHLANTTRPDHTSTSPDGTRCIPSWAYNPTLGTRSYTLDFSSHIMLHDQSEHSDMAITSTGRNVLVTFDYNSGDIAMIDAHNGARTNLMRLYGSNASGVAGHVSGIGSTGRPGYAVVSFYGCTENYGTQACTDAQWFKDKVVIVELKDNPKIYNVAHTQFGGGGYFGETQATVNKDLTKILFVSTWRADQENQLASYMIDIPSALLP